MLHARLRRLLTDMRILIIGGTLFIGKRLVPRLLEAGHDVSLLHRSATNPYGDQVRNFAADRNDAASIRSALAGQRFDAVYDLAYDWQRGTTAAQVEATARAIPGDLSRYIFISSIAAYGDGENHREDDALAADDHPMDYVRNKATSERALFRMHREAQFPAVTFRPPFVYGPENPFYREAFFWDRIGLDRPIIVAGDGQRHMQFVYVDDLVTGCIQALEKPSAIGQAFNIGNAAPVTHDGLVEALAGPLSKQAKIVHVPRDVIERNGGNVFVEPLYFGEYLDVHAITGNTDRVRTVLGLEATPFSSGLAQTYAWHKEHGKRRALDFRFEDKVISEAGN